jgi:predicted phage baseplate assembly protein
VNAIFTNAVYASQLRTITDAPLGAGNGLPNQVLFFTQIPVIAGERIEVQELAGPRANTEWRLIALSLSNGDQSTVRDLEKLLGSEGDQTDLIRGDLRLRRDRTKQVTEVWVRWYEQPNFFRAGSEDRYYVIDRARGLVFFGDGVHGKIPPQGALILARRFRAGGGLAGNVAARAINQILGPIPGVQSAANPKPAEGGADGETIEAFSIRGPESIRDRGRAITPRDYETIAREASPAVAVARAIPTRNSSGQILAGWVTLLIIPQSKDPRPLPSFGLREAVRKYVGERAPGDLAASQQIYVTGPDYLDIGVNATIAVIDFGEAGAVEKNARQALEDFLHPLRGGPDGKGWDLGRDVFLSDIAALLERVDGVDYVKEIELLMDGMPQGDSVRVARDRVVAAGQIRLKIEESEA